MTMSAYRAAIRGCLALACFTAAHLAQAQTTYDIAEATVSSGPAGLIATDATATQPGSVTNVTLRYNRYATGPGCEMTGCAESLPHVVTPVEGGSLRFDLANAPLGDIKGWRVGPGGMLFPSDQKAHVIGGGNGAGSFYTELTDPARTSFSFVFSGHSAAAGQGVQVRFGVNDLEDFSQVLFSQTVTSNQAGAWQLVVETPLGMDPTGKNMWFDLGAASGTNTVSSLLVTPRLHAVPEPATWALMGLGLIGLAVTARSRRA